MAEVLTDKFGTRFVDTIFSSGKNRLCVDAAISIGSITLGGVFIEDDITGLRADVVACGTNLTTSSEGLITLPCLVVRDDVLSVLSVVDGAFTVLRTDNKGALHVNIGATTDFDIRDLSHLQDSIKIGDGAEFLAINTDGSINIKAVDLDIRNLDCSTDSILICDSNNDELGINTDGSINVVATATDLDIRDLSHIQDSIKIGDGSEFLAINTDGSINIGNTITVSATDLDIRDISCLTDNIAICDAEGDELKINTDGSINVNVSGGTASIQFKVDDVAGATDTGTVALVVRDDVLSALTPADGDYVRLRVDSEGALWVKQSGDVNISDGGNSITVDDGGLTLSVDDNGGSLTVDAVNLDIRDLTHATDSIKIGDGNDFIAVNTDGSINVIIDDGGGSITIDTGGLTISVDDGGSSLTVDAVDFDIRDLTHISDSIRLGDGTTLTDVITSGGADRLAVDAFISNPVTSPIPVVITSGAVGTSIIRQAEHTLTTRTETDIPSVTFTVGTGKVFQLSFFGASADSPAPVMFRLKVDGALIFKLVMGGGQGAKTDDFTFTVPVTIATAGQVVKITVEPNYKNGVVWAGFTGLEV